MEKEQGKMMAEFTDIEEGLIGSYHDNCRDLQGMIDNQGELDRLNAWRNEDRTMEDFNRVIREAIRLRENK